MAKVRVLILTSSTGGGHDARAQAFAEWCFQLYRHQVDVRIEQMLEQSSVVNKGGVNFYNWIQKRMPVLHKAFYAVVELLAFLNRRSVTFGRGYYETVIEKYKPHVIFSVHDCLNRGYFQLARKKLGPDRVKCVTYCGEFSGGWGYSINWIEPTVDLYISRTPTARDYAIKKGIHPERAIVRGHLMRPRTHLEVLSGVERQEYLVRRLGLRPDLFTVFLATGGNGANNHAALLPALLKHADKVQVIIICGKDKQAYNEMIHWRSSHPDLNCYVEGFSEVVHLLMQVSDAIVTRGGTTTCAKALHFRCPIIFNGFGGVMPQENLTCKFFINGAGSPVVGNAGDFARIIDAWMYRRNEYIDYLRRFNGLRYEEDPTLVVREVIELGETVVGASLRRNPFPPRGGTRSPLADSDPA